MWDVWRSRACEVGVNSGVLLGSVSPKRCIYGAIVMVDSVMAILSEFGELRASGSALLFGWQRGRSARASRDPVCA